MCNKIGHITCFLLIALLRLAEIILLPTQSPWTMPVVDASCKIMDTANEVYDFFHRVLFENIWLPFFEFTCQYIPLMLITILLYFASCTFCFINGCLWWIPYIKLWWMMLSKNGRSVRAIFRDGNPKEGPKEKQNQELHGTTGGNT